MTAYAFRTRRMLLRDMGKAGLAIMVLGAAACSSEEGDPEGSTTSEAGDDPTTTQAEPTTTTSSAGAPGGTLDWQRANLGFVSAYILYRNGEAALIDTGVPDSEGDIEAAIREVGLGWDSVGHVIVTHLHNDHQGSLPAVLAATGDAPWYAGEADIGGIDAPTAGIPVGDGDSVFDLEIIESPGHTLGHVCALDNAGGVLIAGDALFGENGGVVPSLPQFTADMDMANASVSKLAGFDYEVLLFGHGEPILSRASQAVSDLAATL